MTMKYSTVKCTKSTNTANFAEGKSYRMFHASHDDVIETTDGRAFGITAQLEHATSHGNFQFQLVGESTEMSDFTVALIREGFGKTTGGNHGSDHNKTS